MTRDLADRRDVEALVSGFYERVFADPTIGPIFTEVARVDPARHLPVMVDFWETVLFRTGAYRRNALEVHKMLNARFPLEAEHFDRWLELWQDSVRQRFEGEKADLALVQAGRIAGSIQQRLAGRSGSNFETIRQRDVAEPGEPAGLAFTP